MAPRQITKMGCCTRSALTFVNIIVFALGAGIIITASILISYKDNIGFLFSGNYIKALPLAALIIGIIMLVVCVVGCIGGLKGNATITKAYAGMLFLLLIAQLVVGIMILVNTTISVDTIQDDMNETFKKYGNDSSPSDIDDDIDNFQKWGYCCGVLDYRDWASYPYGKEHNNSVPDSCCKGDYRKDSCGQNVLLKQPLDHYIYTLGCSNVVETVFLDVGITLGIFCVVFLVAQLVSICCVCGLARIN